MLLSVELSLVELKRTPCTVCSNLSRTGQRNDLEIIPIQPRWDCLSGSFLRVTRLSFYSSNRQRMRDWEQFSKVTPSKHSNANDGFSIYIKFNAPLTTPYLISTPFLTDFHNSFHSHKLRAQLVAIAWMVELVMSEEQTATCGPVKAAKSQTFSRANKTYS